MSVPVCKKQCDDTDMRGLAICIGAIAVLMLLTIMLPGQQNLYTREAIRAVLFWLVIPGGICLEIVDFVRRRRTIKEDLSVEPLKERIITERVLVICPFCSTKVEQGVAFCPNCGGKM